MPRESFGNTSRFQSIFYGFFLFRSNLGIYENFQGVGGYLIGFMIASIAMSFTHRYFLLLPLSALSNLNPRLVRVLNLLVDYSYIVISGEMNGTMSFYFFLTVDETKKKILEAHSFVATL